MPVKFQAESEYDRQFKWIESMKSASFEPTQEQRAAVAGVASTESGLAIEPAIQRRKKTGSPVKSLPVFPDNESVTTEDDFFLLGDNAKFGQSVQYRNSRKALKQYQNLSKGKTYKINIAPDKENRDRQQPPSEPLEKACPLHTEKSKSKEKISDFTFKKSLPKQDNVPELRKSPPKAAVKRSHAGKPRHPEMSKTIPKKSTDPPTPMAPRESKQVEVRETEKRTSQKVQTEPAKQKSIQTEKVAPKPSDEPDLALQHRAGMKPSRPDSIKRLSEYQKQFQWKQGMQASPMLAADEIIYKSSPVLKPQVTLPYNSEYQKQYQIPPEHIYTPPLSKPDGASPSKKANRESEPVQDKKETRKSPQKQQNLTDKEKRLIKDSANPQKPFPPHGKHRRTKSEYAANFRAPMTFVYQDGAWKGAKPAHMSQDDTKAPDTASSWYQEVLELRQKAEEYRKRALGTHFSRMHTAQVLAKNADLWDTASSTESRTVSALSLETGSQSSSRRATQGTKGIVPALDSADSETSSVRVQIRKAWQAPEEDSKDSCPLSSASHRSLCGSDSNTLVETPRDEPDVDDESTDDEGRIPTPRLKVQPVRRHHLDVTTPAVGGAMLTSPPHQSASRTPNDRPVRSQSAQVQTESVTRLVRPKQPMVKQHHRHGYENEVKCTCGADDEYHVTPKPRPITVQKQKTPPSKSQSRQPQIQRAITPTYGKPTDDRQPLLDEEASTDRPLVTKYTSPIIKSDVNPSDMRTIDERFGETYITPPRVTRDDDDNEDALSTSMQSIASSCSVASETLERARNRRDFWSDKQVGTV